MTIETHSLTNIKLDTWILVTGFTDPVTHVAWVAGQTVLSLKEPSVGLWMRCIGTKLPVNDIYANLYNVIGTTYMPRTIRKQVQESAFVQWLRRTIGKSWISKFWNLPPVKVEEILNPDYQEGYFRLPDFRSSIILSQNQEANASLNTPPTLQGSEIITSTNWSDPYKNFWRVTIAFNSESQARQYHEWVLQQANHQE